MGSRTVPGSRANIATPRPPLAPSRDGVTAVPSLIPGNAQKYFPGRVSAPRPPFSRRSRPTGPSTSTILVHHPGERQHQQQPRPAPPTHTHHPIPSQCSADSSPRKLRRRSSSPKRPRPTSRSSAPSRPPRLSTSRPSSSTSSGRCSKRQHALYDYSGALGSCPLPPSRRRLQGLRHGSIDRFGIRVRRAGGR
ncbi:hypothetical protein BT67DRAFT_53386 [Trichocladium antarcticum]|uniref:Uncharacterized protein n=1 Tax=Trichocladium antarcticum TaxID=1450529 RepID=A0AAN6UIM6_9PEZI|nr:hypothetical protein BT67DRAFT_53386 [Trichocladium antarcticum]